MTKWPLVYPTTTTNIKVSGSRVLVQPNDQKRYSRNRDKMLFGSHYSLITYINNSNKQSSADKKAIIKRVRDIIEAFQNW